MIKTITLLKRSNILLKLFSAFTILLLAGIQSVFAQGAVYPLRTEVCQTTAGTLTLKWEGTVGNVDTWQMSTNGNAWSPISVSGGVPSTYDISIASAGTYQVRAYVNLGGGNYQYSVAATVIVYAPSTADASVSLTYDGSTRCQSNNAGTVVLNGGYTGSIKNWVYSTTGSDPWIAIGNTTNTLSYSDLPNNTYYKVEIKNGVCASVLTTNTALINVTSAPDGGTISAVSTSVCEGSNTTLSVVNNVGTTTDWQINSGSWTNVGSGSTYNTSSLLTPGIYNYRVNSSLTCKDRVNATVTQTDASNVLSITVNQNTSITNPSGSTVVSSADPTVNSLLVTPSNGSVVRWELSEDGLQWSPLTNTSNTYNFSNLTQTTYYRVVTQNGACAEAYSNTPAIVTVANGGTISASATSFCNPSSAATLSISGQSGTSYTWESSVSPFTSWTAVQSNVSSITVSNLTQTTQYRVNINSGKAYSNALTLTVNNPSISGSLSTASQSVCSADATTRTIALSGQNGSVVRWEYSNYNGEPWTSLSNTNTSLDFNNLTQSTWYRAVVQSGACATATTASIKIEVVGGGTVSGTTNICANDGLIRTLTLSGYTGTINYWERSEYDNSNSTWGAYQNVGNGGSPNFTYINLTKSTRYRAVITSSCATDVTSAYAEITVNSASVGGTLSSAATVRPGANAGTITLSGNNGNVIRWESSITNNAPWDNIVNTSTSLSYTNLTQSTYYRAIVQNGACSEVASSNSIKITIAASGDVLGSTEVCNSDPTVRTLTYQNYVGTISRWQQSLNAGVSWSDIPVSANKVTLNYSGLTQTTYYRAVITEDGGDIYATPAIITVNPLPIPSFTAPTVCYNNPSVFTSTSVISSGSILSHNWYFADGKGSSLVAPNYTYSNAGTYAVKLVLVSDKLCRDSLTQNVTVSPLPATDFTFTNVCENKVMSFTNNTTLAGATLTYAWTFGNGTTSILSDPTNTYPVKGNYSVTLTATANGLCSKAITKSVTVYENPVADFSFTNICDGTAMSFVNNSYVSDGNLTSAWDFDDNSATSNLASPSYKFTVADTFNVKLTVTTANACTHNVTKKVQVYPMPIVDFTAVSNCFGSVTTFTNNTFIATGSNTYAWDFKNGNTSTALNPTQTYSSAGSYYAKLTATSDRNCIASKEKEVIIHYNPKAQFSFDNICAKDTVNFVNQSSSYGDAITYAWNFGDNSTSTTSNPQKVYNTASNYNVKLVVSSTFGCKDSVSQSVVVYPNPVASFTFSPNTCLGSATQFTSTSTVASGSIKNYLYDYSNGSTSNLKNPNYAFANAATYPVLLTVTTDRGCTDTLRKNIVVSPLPAADFEFNNVCATKTTSFQNKTVLAGATLTYAWIFGNSQTSNAVNPTTVYNTKGSYNVTLTATANGICTSSITKSVTAYENPVADFAFTNVCDGNAVNFASKAYISQSNLTYLWNFNDVNNTSILANPSYKFSKVDSFFVKQIVTSPNGCTDSITKKVEVYPNPVVDFTPIDNCLGAISKFTNNSTITSGTQTYAWLFNDGTSASATTTNANYTYSNAGSYNVKLTATSNKGCVSYKEKGITIHANPRALFSFNNACSKDTISFQNLALSFGDTVTYKWTFGDSSPISTLHSPKKVYTSNGSYQAKLLVTTTFGCKDSVSQNVAVYPNPVANFSYNGLTCLGKQTTFTNTSTLASGIIANNTWDFNNGIVSNLVSPTYKFANTGTYKVVLKIVTDKGCQDTISKQVVISPQPVAGFSYTSVCAGSALAFSNASTSIDVTSAYNWAFGDTVGTSTQTNPVYTFNNPRTYSVKLVVVNGSSCADSVTKDVEIYPNAVVNFNKVDTCSGLAVNFKSTSTVKSGLMYFDWNFGNGASSVLPEPSVIYTNAGTYPVILKVKTDKGCLTQKTISTIVDPNPQVSFVASDVCYQYANQFNSTTTIASGTVKYVWDFGDQGTDTLASTTHKYSNPGTFAVKLTATSDKGCVGSTARNTDVYPKPHADFTFANVCAGKQINFTNSSSVISGSMTYSWDLGNAVTVSTKNPQYVYTKDTTYNVTLFVTSNKSCKDTITKQISIYPLPIADFETDSVCDGYENAFTNKTTIADSVKISYYQWDFGDLSNSLQANPKHQFLNQGDYNVTLFARSAQGCEDSVTKVVTVMPVPVTNFSAASVCVGKNTNFVNLTTNVVGTPTYNWNFGDSSVSALKEPIYLYKNPRVYAVKLVTTSTFGCKDSLVKNIEVYGLPIVKLPNDTTVSRGYSIDIIPTVSKGTYAWTPDTSLSGLSSYTTANVTATPMNTSTYVLSVTDNHSCINTDTMILNIRVDYAMKDLENTISNVITNVNNVWKVPTITFYPDNSVYIFDRWGKEVYKANNYQNNWEGYNENGDKLPDGTYYFIIDFGSSKVVHKGAITIMRDMDNSPLFK